jgi:hypothetical protein
VLAPQGIGVQVPSSAPIHIIKQLQVVQPIRVGLLFCHCNGFCNGSGEVHFKTGVKRVSRSANLILITINHLSRGELIVPHIIQEAAWSQNYGMSARYAYVEHTTLHNAMAVLNR